MTITEEPSLRPEGPSAPLRRAPHSPQRCALGPVALLDLLADYVAETASFLAMAPPDLPDRRYELLELTGDFDIWAIHWPRGQGLELHDHGGAAGALWVVEGSLEEHYIGADGAVSRRSIVAGGGAAFGPRYVHDVVNVETTPATSVHAYSPPLESMNFYRRDGRRLRVERAEHRSDSRWAP